MLINTDGVVLQTAAGVPGVSCPEDPVGASTETVVAAAVANGTVSRGEGQGNSTHRPMEPAKDMPPLNTSVGDQGAKRPASPQMKAPHVSTVYDKQEVMMRHFGVTQKQALRTQALLRLGVTEQDVRIAERLMGSRTAGGSDNTHSKEEWLLGVTYAQMSFHKALQVLGISEAVVEEDRSRRLGELGSGRSPMAEGIASHEGEDMCGRFFAKKRRSASPELGTTLPGEVAFAPTHTRVLQLEEVCHTQMTRIQQLESQLAALSARPSSSGEHLPTA